jgi:hypothetical protein
MSGLASVILVFLPIIFPSWFGDSKVLIHATWAAAAGCFLVANYAAWLAKRNELQEEKAKNEFTPQINISVLNIVTCGSLGSGLTDVFVYLELVLQSPSRVSILDCSLMLFSDYASTTIPACEDIPEWQLEKWDADNNLFHIRCEPLVKELKRRGDPVQGWIHFPLPSVAEGVMGSYGVKIELNCAHGTCYFNTTGGQIASANVSTKSRRKMLKIKT